jgi:hypothetical protein
VKYALISDIHSNLPALEAVLADIDARGDVDVVYHLGDLVGYAPWPDEVVALVRGRGIGGIGGNYDSTVANDYKHCGCKADSPRAEELSHMSYGWTRVHVSSQTKAYLGGLPFKIDVRPRGGTPRGPRSRSSTVRPPSTPSTGPRIAPTPSARRWRRPRA